METKIESQETPQVLADMIREGIALQRIENDTQVQIAIQRPRKIEVVLQNALQELEQSPEFASMAYYSIEYRKSRDEDETVEVSGLSIRAAEALSRLFGNCASGGRIIGETEREYVVEGVFVDYETNNRVLRQVRVPKQAKNKKTGLFYPLSEDRLNLAVLAGISKAIRNAILSGLPVVIKERYYKHARELAVKKLAVKKDGSPAPLKKRIEAMVKKFSEIGVSPEMIAGYYGYPDIYAVNEAQIADLIGIYNSIKDGLRSADEIFGKRQDEKQEQVAKDIEQILGGVKEKDSIRREVTVYINAIENCKQKKDLVRLMMDAKDKFQKNIITSEEFSLVQIAADKKTL
jgi:hypothetical protein